MDIATFALDQVSKSGRQFITRDKCILITCPVHSGGMERTPSRKINISDPRFKPLESYCYACHDEKKTLSWNELAAITNMSPIRSDEDDEDGDEDQLWLKLPTDEDFYGSEGEDISHYPWKGNWKRDGVTISGKFLRKMGATLVNSRDEPRLYLPVKVDDIEVGNVQCIIDKNEESSKIKYLLSGKWTNYTLYPVDDAFPLAEKLGYLIIVEGARDALNLLQYGVPTVCIWGTNGWNRAKLDILRDLNVKIVVAMDGDEPGRSTRDKIVADLVRTKVRHSVINFEDDSDPGTLTENEVLELRTMLGGRKSTKSTDSSVHNLYNYYIKLRRRGNVRRVA